jgi:VIT1/CCC1 family predicted Fe2+/Mn2+ transporter
MADPTVALDVHAREELGISPENVGSPFAAAGASFAAFALGAAAPLVPWFIGGGTAAVIASLVIGLFSALFIGLLLAQFTERSRWRTALRQVAVAAVSCLFTFLLGRAVGTQIT